jgi:hypothetical protein
MDLEPPANQFLKHQMDFEARQMSGEPRCRATPEGWHNVINCCMMLEQMPPLGGYQQNRTLGRGLGKEGIQHFHGVEGRFRPG